MENARIGRDSLVQRVAFFAFCTIGCGASQAPAQESAALLALHGLPDGALVHVDGEARGAVGRTGGVYLVDAGRRRLVIRATGYLPFWLEVELVGGEAYDMPLELWPCFEEVDAECWPRTEGTVGDLFGAGNSGQ